MRQKWWLMAVMAVAAAMLAEPMISVGSAQEAAPDKFQLATKGAKKVEGLWTVYSKDQQILVEFKPAQLQQEYLMLSSLARGVSGVGNGFLSSGMTWGDDVIWTFRKVGEKVHLLKKNVRFKAKPGSPEATAVSLSYSDSVMYALPIVAETGGNVLVDMTRVFMSDDEQIGKNFGGSFVLDRSTINKVKAFPKNVEIAVNAVYATSLPIDTVPDSRGIQVGVHYSISQLPSTGYKPRKADDRVGYFLTATKDFSDNSDQQHFVRYITRWDLQKADPTARLSPPKDPIIFHMERTIPINLRPVVRAGIEEWNKAFEKIGFANAIEVRQQRDDDDWDPEDVRYNSFRWITADAGFAIGPSRVNPLTGQILDADILFDAGFLRSWSRDYNLFATPGEKANGLFDIHAEQGNTHHTPGNDRMCQLSTGMQHQMGFAASALFSRGEMSKDGKLPEEYIEQALKEVVMHEVGHTLGLRHNFKASGWKSLADIEDPAKANEATVASVMDYCPVSIALPGKPQGAYYTKTIGPYDYWAIEYGYKPITGDEPAELKKIAGRSAEPGLDYSTDEDTRGSDADPYSNRFDMGNDIAAFAKRQMSLVNELLPKVVEKISTDGDGYQNVRLAFNHLLGEYWETANFAARLPGGLLVARDHKGDPNGRAPFRVLDAKQQRAATQLLAEMAFSAPKLDPGVVNYLATNKWSHWGTTTPTRQDLALHQLVETQQLMLLSRLMSSLTLSRIQDNERKVGADEDAYTLAEHLDLVVVPTFSELNDPAAGDYTARKPLVDSYRRNLQRAMVKALGGMATRSTGAPDDARVLARVHLDAIKAKIEAAQKKDGVKLDPYTSAHLTDLKTKIELVEKAQLTVSSVD
ncbi:MAG: hypothetical protein C0478_01100 [Planctomyces sp.]|nr:hypothetical protein [Planctomyces sp.]